MMLCMCVCTLFIHVHACVGIQAMCVSAGECKADRPLTSQRNTLCISGLFSSHTLPKCLKLRISVTGSVDESSHWIFSYFLFVQVLKYLDYVFTGVFTFEMVIKVRGCQMKVHCDLSCEQTQHELGDLQVKIIKDSLIMSG